MINLDDKQDAFEMFARAYPHEAYESEPEMFFEFMRKEYGHLKREEIIKLLDDTK